MKIGDTVRVLPPFDDFAGEYEVVEINQDGVVFLNGIESGFDPMYLEVI